MTPDQRNYLSISRIQGYYGIMRTTMFTFLGLAALIHLGPDGYSAPLTMMVIATAAYGILAGGSALSDMINLAQDMDADMKATAFGRGVTERNLPALKMTSAVLMGLIGLSELSAIFF